MSGKSGRVEQNVLSTGVGMKVFWTVQQFAEENPRMNMVVYSQLAAATVDGVAYHLVCQFEETKDGHAAWWNLTNWYDGDIIQSETAENLRVKLENLKLHSGVTGSEFVNKFLAWFRDLEKVPGEGYTKSHAVYLFLKNITDPDYQTTVTFCRNTNSSLEACVGAVRKQERDLQQKRMAKRQFSTTVRRMKADGELSDDESIKSPTKKQKKTKARKIGNTTPVPENTKFEGELSTTEKGLLRFNGTCWNKMEDEEKEFVREYNSTIKHGESPDKVTMPKGITVKARIRRTQVNETTEQKDETSKKTPTRRRKGVVFGLSDDDHLQEDEET